MRCPASQFCFCSLVNVAVGLGFVSVYFDIPDCYSKRRSTNTHQTQSQQNQRPNEIFWFHVSPHITITDRSSRLLLFFYCGIGCLNFIILPGGRLTINFQHPYMYCTNWTDWSVNRSQVTDPPEEILKQVEENRKIAPLTGTADTRLSVVPGTRIWLPDSHLWHGFNLPLSGSGSHCTL